MKHNQRRVRDLSTAARAERWSLSRALLALLLTVSAGPWILLSGTGCRPLSQITGLGGKPGTPPPAPAAVAAPSDAPDVLKRSLIVPNKPADITASVGVFRLTSEDSLPDLPSTPSQTVQRESANSLLVKVVKLDGRDGPAEYLGRAYPDELQPYLRPTSWLQSGNADLYRQAYNCLKGTRRISDVASNLEAGVDQWIKNKNLDTGFATALDTLRSHSGDCTEHALLLAAFARSQRIPSRVVSGIVYADQFVGRKQVFSYHMWTELYVGGRWVPYDAALHSRGGFDVTHIALAVSDMTAIKADVEFSAKTSGLVGKLKVEVLPADTPVSEGGASSAASSGTSVKPPPPPPLPLPGVPTVPDVPSDPPQPPSLPSPPPERVGVPAPPTPIVPPEPTPLLPMAVPITPPAMDKPTEKEPEKKPTEPKPTELPTDRPASAP